MQLIPYLHFNGRCQEAFKFYEQVLGGKIEAMLTYGETPAADHVGAEFRDRIIHACLKVGGAVLMASDSPYDCSDEMKGASVSLHVEDTEAADRIFNALVDGGTVKMPCQETFWSARFGMLVDRFGTPWMINCTKAG
jgi:PhnB protein